MATERLFEKALGVESPWFVKEVCFDEKGKVLTIGVDFKASPFGALVRCSREDTPRRRAAPTASSA